MITGIIVVIISVVINIILIFVCMSLYQQKKEADVRAETYNNMFFKLKQKVKTQEKQNQQRVDKLTQEIAKLKGMSIDEVWRMF